MMVCIDNRTAALW